MARRPTELEIPVEDTPQFRFITSDSAAVGLINDIVSISLFNDFAKVDSFTATFVDNNIYSIGSIKKERHVRYREAVVRINSKDATQLALLILEKVADADPDGLKSRGVNFEKITKTMDPSDDE